MKSIGDDYIFCLDYNNNEPFLIPQYMDKENRLINEVYV